MAFVPMKLGIGAWKSVQRMPFGSCVLPLSTLAQRHTIGGRSAADRCVRSDALCHSVHTVGGGFKRSSFLCGFDRSLRAFIGCRVSVKDSCLWRGV